MATLDELHQALVNADAAGDTAGAQALADHIRAMQAAPASAPISPAMQVADPSQNWSNIGAESLQTAGIKPVLTDHERTIGRLLSMIPANLGDETAASLASTKDRFTPQEQPAYDAALGKARDVQSRYQADSPIESTALSLPGNIAATYALPGGPLVQGAVGGAAQGFGAGEGSTDRLTKGGIGGLTGLLTSALFGGAGKVASQPNVNPNVKTLLDEGVPLTPGQMMGGAAKKMEDIATSIPILGDFIAKRQGDSVAGLNRAAANRSLDEIGGKLPDGVAAGRDTVAYVRDAMTKSYTKVLSAMSAKPDMTFSSALQSVKANAAGLPQEQLGKFNSIINAQIFDKVAKNGGTLDGDALKGIESELSKEIKGYGVGSWDDQKLASALGDAKTAFRDLITRQNPKLAPALAATDRAYAQYAILRKAGGALGNDEGVFSPAQLQGAVKAQDASAGKGNFASGTARMQDLSDAAKAVLPSKVPDSGTARRLMTATMLGGGGVGAGMAGVGGVMANLPAIAGTALAGGAAVGAYTTPGQQLLRSLLAGQRPASIAALGSIIEKLGPGASAILPSILRASGN